MCFGVFAYKYYAMVFAGSCFMPYKRHDDIVDVARYIEPLLGIKINHNFGSEFASANRHILTGIWTYCVKRFNLAFIKGLLASFQ